MTTKLVCRLLTVDHQLLGWCAHEATISGDGFLRASSPVTLFIEQAGAAHELSIHWADLNVETVVPLPREVKGGDTLVLFAPHAAMIQAGSPPAKRLPPVSVGVRVEVPVPVGIVGAHG